MSLKIIVENDRNHLLSFEFTKNLITVGRAIGSDIVLAERNVSRHHFQFEILDKRIIIEDMGSYNSTIVNQREIVRKTEMFPGDIIVVGDYNVYIDEEGWTGQSSEPLVDEGPIVASENMLLLHNGPNGGNTVSLQALETIIGSHAGADVYIYAPNMPEIHSKIIFDGNMYIYVKGDYSDDRKLMVNDTEIDSINMQHEDIMQIADLEIEFIEKNEEYNSYPYLLEADKNRRERLLKEIEEKKIRSIYDDEENTEITKRVKAVAAKNPKTVWIGVGVFVGVILILIFLFIFGGVSKFIG